MWLEYFSLKSPVTSNVGFCGRSISRTSSRSESPEKFTLWNCGGVIDKSFASLCPTMFLSKGTSDILAAASTSTPRAFNSASKSTLWIWNTTNGLLSISRLIMYITAAICLQGTAQSGQLHCILKSVHFSGNIFRPHSDAMSRTAGSSSCLSILDTISGRAIIPSMSLSMSSGKNGGIISVTEYGLIRLP